jgi:hypothetical protein
MTIDVNFNYNPFIGDVTINADSACTSLICIEDLNDPGQYIVKQDIIINNEGRDIAHIILKRYTKDMTNEDALYFIENYYNRKTENPRDK